MGGALDIAARFSGGSPGRAMALLDDPVFLQRDKLADDLLGLTVGPQTSPLAMGEWAEISDKRPSDGRSRLAQQRDLTRSVLDLIKVLVRDLMLVKARGSTDRLINVDLYDSLSGTAQELTWAQLSAILTAVREAEDAVVGNVTPRLVLENLAIRVIDSGH